MIKAVLLDLDNTLLHNPDEVFATAYLRLVDEYFQARWQFSSLSKYLLQTIGAMAGQRDMQRTNIEVALEIISVATGHQRDEIDSEFANFYMNAYPQLRKCTEPLGKITQQLVEKIQAQKYAMIIATNPIYPAEAVRQRLEWSGLSNDFEDYALVTHAENMHFVKPSPAYYAEIVARVGVEPDEAIMVGDNLKNDILPAQQVGLHTYHIRSGQIAKTQSDLPTIMDFYRELCNEGWGETFASHPPTVEMIEPEMRGNIGALFGTLADAKPHYWEQHPDPNEWSPIQILCHLLESENKVQRPRLEHILAEENPFLAAPPAPAGPKEALPCDTDGFQVAVRFAEARQQTMKWLLALKTEDWQRPARHSIFGPTTLLEMAHFTAQHDRLHINQLCQTLGRCN